MSPIIYTPHECEASVLADLPYGTIWQCETCQALWAATSSAKIEWVKIEDPRREHSIEDASHRAPAQPTTPTVTPDMLQLAVDTYTAHQRTLHQGKKTYCAACGKSLKGAPPFGLHALSMAHAALQDVLDKAGRDATE